MKAKKILLLTLTVLTTTASFAQKDKKLEKQKRIDALVKLEEENEPAFHKQIVFGGKINTDGYGIAFEIGRYKTPKRTDIYQLELNEKFHPKEEKVSQSIDYSGNISQMKFGKANNFFQFKLGYGQQRQIGGKANRNGVAVSYIYAGGLSLGILKPYYVDVQDGNNQFVTRVKFSDTIPENSSYAYLGGSGITVGWGEVKFKPGAHAKTALRFDYGRFNEMVSFIETGLNLEYYTSDILQMAYFSEPSNTEFVTKQNKLFFNAYIAIGFGKRK